MHERRRDAPGVAYERVQAESGEEAVRGERLFGHGYWGQAESLCMLPP